jgi:hypothetical protein
MVFLVPNQMAKTKDMILRIEYAFLDPNQMAEAKDMLSSQQIWFFLLRTKWPK